MFTQITTLLAIASSAFAVPTKRAPSDVDVLQYALTLEHLENAFYSGALAKYDADAFAAAGFPDWVRSRFQQIANHEQEHVTFLSTALGDGATKPCEYSFPDTDPTTFAAVATILEGVGTSAYLGAAQFITNKAYLTAAGSILTTEARHAAWINSAVELDAAWSGPFDVPLGLNSVYSLAAGFITSCPSTNPTLPVKAFPTLSITGTPAPGAQVTFVFDGDASGKFAAFYHGLDTIYAPIGDDKTVTIPESLVGTVYVVVSSNGSGSTTDDTTVAGPAVFMIRLPESAA